MNICTRQEKVAVMVHIKASFRHGQPGSAPDKSIVWQPHDNASIIL